MSSLLDTLSLPVEPSAAGSQPAAILSFAPVHTHSQSGVLERAGRSI
jgi:hypothetical protein